MATKISSYQKVQRKFIAKTLPVFKGQDASDIFHHISTGKNTYLRVRRTESSVFDATWIQAIRDCIPEISDIIKNPRKITKTVPNLVPVELAKKITSESVRHLASHTQFVKEITEEGDVIPSKILSIETDDDYSIYENRFIATLIKRLVLFVERRYEFIMKFAPLHQTEELHMKSSSVVDGSEVEITTIVKVRKPADYSGVEETMEFTKQVEEIRRYVKYFYASQFMKMMKNEKDVRNPILMTNIIRKNPKYNKCYRLFKFIEGYDALGITYAIKDEYDPLNDGEIEELNAALMTNFLALKANNPSKFAEKSNKTYKPKVLTTLDDEEFIYGPILKGPIEMVRVDEAYRKAMEAKLDLPEKMSKQEKAFHEEEIIENKRRKRLEIENDKLMIRKRKEEAAFARKAKIIVAQREAEEQEALRKAKEAELAAIEARKEEARKAIEEAAQEFKKEMEETK